MTSVPKTISVINLLLMSIDKLMQCHRSFDSAFSMTTIVALGQSNLPEREAGETEEKQA